jgi:NAD(P) transhydrogenase
VPYIPAPEPALAGFTVDSTALDNGAIFSTKTRRLLGMHILGEGATELIHIGQAVLNLKGTIDYFIQNTFNYPTLAEAYKIAGLDAWNRMTR